MFADADRLAALNAIVHPFVGRRSAEIMAAAPADAVVVYDVPLLVENNLQGQYDVVVVVDAAPETQVRRLTATRGMTEEDACARMASQAGRDQRNAVADVVLDNSSDVEALRGEVAQLWRRLVDRRDGGVVDPTGER